MIDKITEYLDEETDIKGQFSVNRILIMNGGGNAVKILREIKDYYYITILDNNQMRLSGILQLKRTQISQIVHFLEA